MVTETDRDKARSAVVSAYHALDCVTIPFSFLHAFADAAVDAVSTDAEPVKHEPYGYAFQHEDTGLEQVVDVQQVEWGFERNNPRWQKLGPVYLHQPSEVKTAPAVAVKLDSIAHRVHALARMVGTSFFEDVEKDLRDLSAALSAQVQDVGIPEGFELYGHWSKHRLSDGCFLPLPCYVPEGPDYTTIALYRASPASKHGDAE